MTFDEILAQVLVLLQREKRVSYRALKRRFALDDDYIDDLKVELIRAKQLARDEDGEILVWAGEIATIPAVTSLPPAHQDIMRAGQPLHVDSPPSELRI